MWVCSCSMLLYVPSSFAIILMGKRESWLLCLVCLPGVLWLLCGSSLRCHGFVCSLWLCYFEIILFLLDAVHMNQFTTWSDTFKRKCTPLLSYLASLCVRAAKDLTCLLICADAPEPLLFADSFSGPCSWPWVHEFMFLLLLLMLL